MSTRKFVMLASLALGLSTPLVASASTSTSNAPCIFKEHRVTSVTPYRASVRQGKATLTRLKGAEIRLQAEPGLTAEWLRLNLGRHLAAMQSTSMPDCSLDVDDVRIEVRSAGAGFAVRLIAQNSEQGQEVLRRARLLLD